MVSMRIVDHVKGHFPTEVFGIASKKNITDFKEIFFFLGANSMFGNQFHNEPF